MPTLDPTRATFVQNAYRYAEAVDSTVKATYPSARELPLDTNLETASLSTYATKVLNRFKTSVPAYQIEGESALMLENFTSAPMVFTLVSATYGETGAKRFQTVGVEIDYQSGISILKVRG